MPSVDPSPRAFPPIRRLVVVALVALLAVLLGRQVVLGRGSERSAEPAVPVVAVGAAVDEHAIGSVPVVLPAVRRPSVRDALVAVPVVAADRGVTGNGVTLLELPLPVPAGEPLWAPLGPRAPPIRA